VAIESLHYLDIPAEKRALSAAKAINRITEQLNTPGLSVEARKELQLSMTRIQKWASGRLEEDNGPSTD